MSKHLSVNSVRGVLLVMLLASVSLAGCIRTTQSVFTEEASPEKALQERVALARQYIGDGNWDAAKRNLKLAKEINPNSPEVHEAFALIYWRTGEYEMAEENFKDAIRMKKNFSRCRNNYAAFLYSQERYEEAEKQLVYVVQDTLFDARPLAFANLGLCRLRLFDTQGAEEAFVRALSMDRTNTIALFELARIRYEAQDYVTAIQFYDTFRNVSRRQSAPGLLLGIQLAQQTGDRDAEASYALALGNLFPASPEYQAYRRTVGQ